MLVYESPDLEGSLIDLARAHELPALVLLREANTKIEGVTPVFDGIDVFPGENEAEIIVRWRYPGQAELRTVEKYRYDSSGITAIDRSELASPNRRMEWRRGLYEEDVLSPASGTSSP